MMKNVGFLKGGLYGDQPSDKNAQGLFEPVFYGHVQHFLVVGV
jgi:hypothetical protein